MKKTFISRIIFSFLVALVGNSVLAQEYTYDLNKYYTPAIVRNGLDLDFNTNGSLNDYSSPFSSSSYLGDTTNTISLSGNLNSTFSSYISTRKTESYLRLNLNLRGTSQNQKSGTVGASSEKNSHSTTNSENLGVDYSQKQYGSRKEFLSYGVLAYLNPAGGYSKEERAGGLTSERTSTYLQAAIAPFIGVGTGRIESVKDARQAIYILNDLSKNGVLTRQLSEDEIFKFAQLISQVKNKRFLDARLHKIDEISTVDSFFVNNNLLTRSDARYFSTLYDNWENSANFERNSGQVFELKLSPTVSLDSYKQIAEYSSQILNTEQKNSRNIYGANLTFNYSYAKQMNMNWENEANAWINGSTLRTDENFINTTGTEYPRENNIDAVSLYGRYSIGYYPSTRTNVSAYLSQYFSQSYFKDILDNSSYEAFSSNTSLGLSAIYYVSPQLSLTGQANIMYQYYDNSLAEDNYKNKKQLSANFAVALKYSFF